MLDIALLVLMSIMAYRISAAIRGEAFILKEFKQTSALALWVWLFPVGVLILALGAFLVPFPVANLVAIACYLPAVVIARRQGRALETAGTDRVKGAQSAISRAFGNAVVGLIYVAAVTVFQIGVTSITNFK